MRKSLVCFIALTIFLLISACQQKREEPVSNTPSLAVTPVEATNKPTQITVTQSLEPSTEAYKLEARDCETYKPTVEDREGETFFCGALILPQNKGQPDGQKIEIRYAIVRSHSENPLPDPILFLSGGPGSSAIHPDAFPELVRRFNAQRQNRDLIFFDQRGVGYSYPPFDCVRNPMPPEGDKKAELDQRYENSTGLKISEIPEEFQFEYTCVTDLWNKGIELTSYNSVANALDTVNLMQALTTEFGYPSYNLYGISYGTRLALTILRDYPSLELVRSMTLDSVFPVEKGEYRAQYYIERNQLFESIFQLCEQDSTCSQTYPDLRNRFGKLVDQLNTSPLQLLDETSLSGNELYQSMYPQGPDWPQRIPYFPKMIAELEQGQMGIFMGFRDGSLLQQNSPEVHEGVYNLMDEMDKCTKISDPDQRQPYYRQMYNASREKVLELFAEMCIQAEMAPIKANLESMTTTDINELVKRLYDPRENAAAAQLRKSMDCYEEVPFGEDPQTAEAKLKEANLPEFFIEEALATIQDTPRCNYWPTGAAPDIEDQPVVGSAAMLILNGQFDSITYPWWAQETQENIEHSYYFMVPGATHSIAGNNGACVDELTTQFLNEPGQAPAADCLSELKIQFIGE